MYFHDFWSQNLREHFKFQFKKSQHNKIKINYEMDSYSLRYLNENKDDKIRWRSFMSITLVSCVEVNFHLG